jgi:hypothetical protein
MALSAFDDRERLPSEGELTTALGGSSELWLDLKVHLTEEYAPLEELWGFTGPKWGWSLRMVSGKRTVLYLTPSDGYFYVGFAYGEKAATAALESDLPASVKEIIEGAKKFAEGRAIRMEVRGPEEGESVKKMATIKMAN